jgi:hypothetical protein
LCYKTLGTSASPHSPKWYLCRYTTVFLAGVSKNYHTSEQMHEFLLAEVVARTKFPADMPIPPYLRKDCKAFFGMFIGTWKPSSPGPMLSPVGDEASAKVAAAAKEAEPEVFKAWLSILPSVIGLTCRHGSCPPINFAT